MMKINGEMVALAREYRGMTQQELADRLEAARSTIAKLESGLRSELDDEVAQRLPGALGFPEEFFSQDEQLLGFGSSAYFYRKRATLPAPERRRIHSIVNLCRMALKRCIAHVDIDPSRVLPQLDLEDYGQSAERAAQALRTMWALPDGPVKDLTALVESAGVVIIPCDFDTRAFDATSLRLADMPPIIFVNSLLPGDRWRFTIAHELGHLVLHSIPHDNMEQEANRFAAEFLTPSREIKPQLMQIRSWQLPDLVPLKLYWKVSLAFLIKRARDLGVLTKDRALKIYMQFAPIRREEPCPLPQESTANLRRVLSAITDELNFGPEGLRDLLRWPSDVKQKLLPSASAPAPKLRLVGS